jgi:hypothetical protein
VTSSCNDDPLSLRRAVAKRLLSYGFDEGCKTQVTQGARLFLQFDRTCGAADGWLDLAEVCACVVLAERPAPAIATATMMGLVRMMFSPFVCLPDLLIRASAVA